MATSCCCWVRFKVLGKQNEVISQDILGILDSVKHAIKVASKMWQLIICWMNWNNNHYYEYVNQMQVIIAYLGPVDPYLSLMFPFNIEPNQWICYEYLLS